MKYSVLMLLFAMGCVTEPPKATQATVIQQKRDKILECIKDLKQNDATTLDSFEVCRQIYKLEKLPDIGSGPNQTSVAK